MAEERETTRTGAVTRRIMKYIRDSRMEPGTRLPTETACMELFGVSRSTLREAVKMLVAMNVLETRQGSGMFVSPRQGIPDDPLGLYFVYDDIRLDLLNVRLLIEPTVAKLAAERATAEEMAAIRQAAERVETCIQAGNRYGEADMAFHQALAAASGNKVIYRLAIAIEQSIEENIAYAGGYAEVNTMYFHNKIVEAIESRNGMQAYYFMTRHLVLFRDHFGEEEARAIDNG